MPVFFNNSELHAQYACFFNISELQVWLKHSKKLPVASEDSAAICDFLVHFCSR